MDVSKRTLYLEELQAGNLTLRDLKTPPKWVDLSNAHVRVLEDDPASWAAQVSLTGFSYEALHEKSQVPARQRLEWLQRSPEGYIPGPYEQLAAVYRRAGRDQDARTVAIAKQRAYRNSLTKEHGRRRMLALPRQLWSLLLDTIVGYGYRTWLAVLWLLGFILVGWWLFDRAHDAQLLVAAKPPGQRPWFHAAVFALDLLLPFADLGYQSSWIADGWARPWYLVWTLAGWILVTAIVAALSGLIRRD